LKNFKKYYIIIIESEGKIMDEMIFMAMAFEHEDLLRDAADAVHNGMDIELAAYEYNVDLSELTSYCRNN
jgi:hypothetical protein